MLSQIDVAKELLKINAVQLNPEEPFTWASGLRSPIYCDNRKILSYPDLRNKIKITLASKASESWAFNKVAGVATAGIAHGALIADLLDLPFIYVRSKPKGHGAKNQIEGQIENGDRCLVVEDLISTGGSSIAAVNVLRDAGVSVSGVIAIFTYEFEKATKAFQDADCPFATISNYSVLIKAAFEMNTLSERQLSSLQEWRKNPSKWSEQFA